MTYFYARVSSKDQNLDRQINTAYSLNIPDEQIFVDQQSGKDFERPGYKSLIETIKPNDVVIIKSIDRLGRDYSEILAQWQKITKEKQADIKVLDMPLLDTTACKDILGTFVADLVLQILSFQAETERVNIKQRQAEGIAAAQAKGAKFGRPRCPLPDNFDELYNRYMRGEPITSLSKECPNISMSTLRLRLLDKMQGKI